MSLTICLPLADSLSPGELKDLAAAAAAKNITIERLIYEALKAEADRLRRENETPSLK
jgi:hypothetical protein